MAIIPPAVMPHTARAATRLSMLCASAHHKVAMLNPVKDVRYTGRLPIVSDSLPKIGWNAVDVSIKAVDNQEAEFEA